jgi:glycosyltransferase involved in cell wall biosynthesis
MRLLYSTRETHPTFRVDLTELFSNHLAGAGWWVTWHMRGAAPGDAAGVHPAPGGEVHVGARAASGLFARGVDVWHAWRHRVRLWCLIRRHEHDAVQVRDQPFDGLLAALAAARTGMPFFYWMSFPYPEADTFRARDPEHPAGLVRRLFYRVRGAWGGWLLYKLVLPRARHVFVQSDRMLDDLAARGVAPSKMTPVPMGIEVKRVETAQVPVCRDPRLAGRLPLVYLGTMVRLRRIDLLLHALALVRQEEPRAVLVMVGDAPASDMRFLRQEAQRLGVAEHVVFTGFVPMEAAWSWIRAAEVCLSPFRPSPILDSCSPTKVVEYLAWGKPVVANHHPDQTAVIRSSQCGVLVDFSAEGFAQGVLQVLRDPAIGERAARCGRDWVRRHRDYPRIAAVLDRRYRDLLDQSAAVRRPAVGSVGP